MYLYDRHNLMLDRENIANLVKHASYIEKDKTVCRGTYQFCAFALFNAPVFHAITCDLTSSLQSIMIIMI